MAVHFDEERSRIEIGVADLLEPQLLRSIGFANRGGFERLWLGQALHGRYQEKALADDPTYRREVCLKHVFDHRGWEVTLTGRADGVRREGDGSYVLEEIKSVRREGQLSAATRQVYERQARLYAWMLARSESATVAVELVLIAIGSDAVERERLECEFEALETEIHKRLNALLAEQRKERRASADRRRAGDRLAFPHADLRPGQERIVEAVERALDQREHLLLEAPTGLGKTAAVLFPALRHALRHDKRLFVLTAKNLQQEMAVKVLKLVDAGPSLHALRLRAKARMCANGEVICHEDYCPFARDYYGKLAASGLVPRLLDEQSILEPDLVFSAAAATEVCPFEVSLDLSRRVEAVVADYNYAFDPYVALSQFSEGEDLSDVVLVIDEAHNLIERGRSYLSPELSAKDARRAAESAATSAGSGSDVHRRMERICLALAAAIEECVASALADSGAGPAADAALEAPLPEEALWRLRPDFDAAFVDYLEYRRETRSFSAEDEFVALYFKLLRFLNGLAFEGIPIARLAERRGDDSLLRLFCKDPGAFLSRVLSRVHSAIAISATLSPFEFFRDLAGFEASRTSSLVLPSPFPPEHRRVVIDRTVTTLWRERGANRQAIADRLSALADAVPGNCLALFPSFQFLADVAAAMSPRAKRVLVQQRGDTEREREAMLATLRGSLLGDVILLAVAGGVFAEGVDYPGDMLRAVAVVGPCLPVPTIETRLLQQYYEERFERGFEFAFVVPGMTRVVQAAGRLIRSGTDQGVIALLDRRFLDSPYRDRLPREWLDEGGENDLHGDPARAAAEFFSVASR
jgi:DNA excision repair protein ERCC-2